MHFQCRGTQLVKSQFGDFGSKDPVSASRKPTGLKVALSTLVNSWSALRSLIGSFEQISSLAECLSYHETPCVHPVPKQLSDCNDVASSYHRFKYLAESTLAREMLFPVRNTMTDCSIK